ncbi:homeobox protein Hox-D13a [Trichomycterus rosablanca]|uniref:homeobox protein Hox-D13a n=1 Tax=Trichomycterus rosablanca TaxID=2290929 RepID=UPI002F352E27
MDMEEFFGERKSVHSLSFYPSAFGAHSNRSSSYSLSDSLSSLSPESLSFPDTSCCANSQIGFGCHFTNSYYSCKPLPSAVFQQRVINHQDVNQKATGRSDDKQNVVGFSRSVVHCGEPPARIRDIGVYQSYTSPYSRIPFDVPVVHQAITSDSTHERPVADGHQSWKWPTSWSNQMYCPKEQPLTEDTTLSQNDNNNDFLRRGRRKRVPYSKLQLKELEHEYTATQFITKEKRRRIASSTNLSERQVTIWFQNRRVKDKKVISKTSKDFEPYECPHKCI